MTIHPKLIPQPDEFRFKPEPRDPENLDPYGAQNHPLPPFKPREEK